jgi:hypothetical protein
MKMSTLTDQELFLQNRLFTQLSLSIAIRLMLGAATRRSRYLRLKMVARIIVTTYVDIVRVAAREMHFLLALWR